MNFKDHNIIIEWAKPRESYDISWAMNKYIGLLDHSASINGNIYYAARRGNDKKIEELKKDLAKVDQEIKQMEWLYPTLENDYNRGRY